MLDVTVNPGDSQLTTLLQTNWVIGDHLVIAATGFNHREAEEVVITAVSGKTITFSPALKFKHFAVEETYGTWKITMRAEVGCLTRNIVIQGDPEDSIRDKYGAHLMIHGKTKEGSVGRIENAEFRYSG